MILNRLPVVTVLAFVGVVLGVGASSLRASLQVLNFPVPYETQNGQCVSGNGAVVVGTTPNGQAGYWTAATGIQPIPKPSRGIGWGYSLHLSSDGAVIAGPGENHDMIHLAAWTWRKGIGVRDVISSNDTADMNNLGVASDGSFVVRSIDDRSGGPVVIRRDYSSGQSSVWTEISHASLVALSEDCSVLYGVATYPGTSSNVPCYWPLSGLINYGTEFLGSPYFNEPVRSSKNGQVIVGVAHTGTYLPDSPVEIIWAFRWNIVTHQIDYYRLPGYLETATDFVSPDGNLVQIGGYLTSRQIKEGIIDQTTPTDAAKGLQNVGAWLVEHRFMTSADTQDRDFSIFSMSDDLSVAVGVFTDKSDHTDHGFIANRLKAIALPPLTSH